MLLRTVRSILWLLLSTNALTIYLASQPSQRLIVTTLACLLLLQLAYFGSVLVLVCLAALGKLSKNLRILGLHDENGKHNSHESPNGWWIREIREAPSQDPDRSTQN
ncbi:exopolysaccharide production repressor protein [Sinorhizobium numidicum]|uniref:exopolysaccharide production repressor protein n=1 Tax=Sinorhizobium numidicum TaxID=680248 RepID=UPI003CC8D468